jgi:hypothetical protein
MKTMFNKAKVKSWIKAAHKRRRFGYGCGYVTDGHILLIEEQHMLPTILEVFSTLTPECMYPAEQFEETMILPKAPIEVIDSRLEYVPDPKSRLRIFYDPATGKELTIDGNYFDLLDNPKVCEFYTNDETTVLWVVCDDKVVGAIASVRLQDQLSHIKFKAEQV